MTALRIPQELRARIAAALLGWYDACARDLPWRVAPREHARGERPDPWRVLLSEFMLQQTTAKAVAPRFETFIARWPSVAAFAAAQLDDVLAAWAGLGYYARARNLHRTASEIAVRGFPSTEEGLQALPGVGAYTAAAVAAIAFDAPVVPVDGNIARVLARLFAVEAPPTHLADLAASIRPAARFGDFAQALMDLGATVCTPRTPRCETCPIAFACAAGRAGEALSFPRRTPKPQRPVRYGAVLARFNRRGEVMLERRPAEGLLGGMLGLPGTAWTETPFDRGSFEAAARAGRVKHAFTHFRLELDVFVVRRSERRAKGVWADPATAALPTVMRKALNLALAASRATGHAPVRWSSVQ